jgi:hypothetical protein
VGARARHERPVDGLDRQHKGGRWCRSRPCRLRAGSEIP